MWGAAWRLADGVAALAKRQLPLCAVPDLSVAQPRLDDAPVTRQATRPRRVPLTMRSRVNGYVVESYASGGADGTVRNVPYAAFHTLLHDASAASKAMHDAACQGTGVPLILRSKGNRYVVDYATGANGTATVRNMPYAAFRKCALCEGRDHSRCAACRGRGGARHGATRARRAALRALRRHRLRHPVRWWPRLVCRSRYDGLHTTRERPHTCSPTAATTLLHPN